MPPTSWFRSASGGPEGEPRLRGSSEGRWAASRERAGQHSARRDVARREVQGPVEEPRPTVQSEGRLGRLCRRALNIVVALIAIVISAPLMLVIAVLVKLTSPGPVFFTQTRVGLDRRADEDEADIDPRRQKDIGGRPFRIFKFRTMTHTPERGREQVWATPDDPRVTGFGRFLRNTRMDELPQFFNVLRGDMNIVGPRPEQPEIFQELREQVDAYPVRQKVLPGITGLAQVSHHYDRSISDVEIKLRHDLEYVSRVSTLEDLRIMARTLPVIFFRKGGW
jgi:lipopolysaccharide/colanic/teichoic acid biosynthesis glycosyltransferase